MHLFIEGLDLPQVDTILMISAHAGATIFLQQLGRGLRRAEGKAVLTVMDFVGRRLRKELTDADELSLRGRMTALIHMDDRNAPADFHSRAVLYAGGAAEAPGAAACLLAMKA